MKPETSKKQEAEISLIKRLTQKQLTYPSYQELRKAEGRRLREFHKEEKKEK